MNKMRTCLFFFCLMLLAPPVYAEPSVVHDEHYEELKQDWLSGKDDHRTLVGLAALANEGDLDAQILLGLIERQPQTHSHITEGLGSEESAAIFRQPGAGFGRTWLRAAAPSSPVAAVLTKRDVEDYEAHAAALAENGLIVQALDIAQLPANAGDRQGTIRALSHPDLLRYTQASLVRFLEVSAVGYILSGETEEAIRMLEQMRELPTLTFEDRVLVPDFRDHVSPDDFHHSKRSIRLRGAALLHHAKLEPLSAILRDVCPGETDYHMGVLFHLTAGLTLEQLLISPLAPVIATAEWRASDRFRGDLMRNWRPGTSGFDILRKHSPCLMEAVSDESQG